jgi:predicted dehydrogenase
MPTTTPLPDLPQASARPPLGVGLIGYGYAGATLHAPLITTTPGLVLRAVASRQADRVHTDLGPAVAVVDAEALLALPAVDIVVIASPNPSHAPLAAAALAAGKHVVIDKPMALDAAQAQPLLALAAARGLQLSVFHNRRWDGDFLTAQALLAEGEAGPLGRLTSAQLHFDRFRPQVRDRWREGDGPGAGLYMDLAPHLIDQALQLFGPPVALAADIACLRPGGRSPDQFTLQWRGADGLRVSLSASMLAALPGPRFALHGTRGSWVKHGLDGQEDALKAGHRPDPAQPQAWGDDPCHGTLCTLPDGAAPDAAPQARAWPNQRGRWPAYYAALRDAVWGLAANPVPPQQALAVMRLMDLGAESARSGRWLTVPVAH